MADKKRMLFVVSMLLLFQPPAAPSALAQQTLWKQVPLGDWFIGSNWNAGVPNSGNSAVFGNPAADGALITAPGAQALNVFIGVITTNPNGTVFGRKGSLTLSAPGGSGTPGNLVIGNRLVIGQATALAAGEGTANISGGGFVTANQVEVAITGDGPFGALNLSQDPSYLATDRFTLGHDTGHATLSIQSGAGLFCAEAYMAGSPYLAGGSSTTGTATVNGTASFWSIDGGFVVGHRGNGSLTISNYGSLLSGETSIATLAGSTGAVTITDSGYWEAQGNIFVSGWSGSTATGGAGSLRVLNGGFARATMLKVFSTGIAQIDNGSTSTVGFLAIGTPPAHTLGGSMGDILVGQNTSGRMEIRNGGIVRGNRGYIGFASGSNGAVLMTGLPGAHPTWQCAGSVWVGNGGNGTLEVREGATVNSAGNGYIAFSSGTTGYALVSGADSEWNTAANLNIGGNNAGPGGSGTLQIEKSGLVTAAATTLYNTGNLALGISPRMGGPLTSLGGSIQALTTTTFAKSFTLGAGGVHVYTNFNDLTFTGLLSGSGALDKTGSFTNGPGTLLLVGNNSYTGGTTVTAGRLLVSSVDGSPTGSGPVTVTTFTGNTVFGGAGIIAGPVSVSSASILLGGNGYAASGALTINNDLTLNPGAKIQLVLAGAGAHSSVVRTAGTWSFPANLAFRFTANGGAQSGLYDNIISGLTSDPGNVGTWAIETPGFTGSFSYDGEGNIDLNLTDAPPATSCDWSTAEPYPIPIIDQGLAVAGNTLYSFSGLSNGGWTANSYKFDGTSWSPIAALPEALESPAVVSDGTSLYIIGGYNSSGTSRNTVYRYNPASDSYTTRAPCLVGTTAGGAVFLNGKIYRIGGSTDAAPTNTVEVYDIASNSWSFRASYPIAAGFVSTFSRNGFIYGAGGIQSGLVATAKTYRYDPTANTWSDGAIADLPSKRWGTVTLLDSSGPVLAGGYLADNFFNPSASVIRWDSATNTWSNLSDLLQVRTRGAGAVLGGRLSVVGGSVPGAYVFDGSQDHQVQECAPVTFTVTTIDDHDDGICNLTDCTLREAIAVANAHIGGDIINFAPGIAGTIQLASVLPDLSSDINLQGPGANLLTVRRSSGPDYRIFGIGMNASVTLSGLTIADGRASGSFPANCGGGVYADHSTLNLVEVALTGNNATVHGGAIFNAQSTIAISNSTLDANSASASGGAIFNYGIGGVAALSLTNCTVYQNAASQYGGAIYNDGTGGGNANLTLLNCTFNQNTATLIAGGIYNDALNPGSSGTATLYLGNTILNAGASGGNLVNDGATVISDGHNLSSDDAGGLLTGDGDITDTDPQLDPAGLSNNGGATQTVALVPNSPAIDTGDDLLAPPTDQRSFARFAISDIGAFEFNGVAPPPPPINISGTISYCPNPVPGPVPDVTLTLTGDVSDSTLSDGSGNYTFSSLTAGGNYTVTPTKSSLAPGSTGITGVDAVATQRHFLNLGTPLSGCRLAAADVTGNSVVDGVDAVAIQRFFLGFTSGIANVGKYQFSPASRTYSGVVTDQTAQDYDTLVFGDVASSFVERLGDPSPAEAGDGDGINGGKLAATVAAIALPEVAVDQSKGHFIAAARTSAIDAQNKLVGFQGDFTFDERVVTFQRVPVQKAGITGGNWNVSGNVLPGAGPIRTLRISAYSNDFTPLSGSGTLFELRMTRVSQTAQSTPLVWAAAPDDFIFIDADLKTHKPGNAAPLTQQPYR